MRTGTKRPAVYTAGLVLLGLVAVAALGGAGLFMAAALDHRAMAETAAQAQTSAENIRAVHLGAAMLYLACAACAGAGLWLSRRGTVRRTRVAVRVLLWGPLLVCLLATPWMLLFFVLPPALGMWLAAWLVRGSRRSKEWLAERSGTTVAELEGRALLPVE